MSRMVQCIKLGKQAEGLDFAPLPGALGQRVFDHVCKQAWQQWLAQQTMLINENRLSVRDPKARAFLETEMENYFFGDGSKRPDGYVAPQQS